MEESSRNSLSFLAQGLLGGNGMTWVCFGGRGVAIDYGDCHGGGVAGGEFPVKCTMVLQCSRHGA